MRKDPYRPMLLVLLAWLLKVGSSHLDIGVQRIGQLALQIVDFAGLGHASVTRTQVQCEVGRVGSCNQESS